jgi:RHS repeat-associated protein
MWRWNSDPFGTTQPTGATAGSQPVLRYDQRFPGQLYERETGLHYNGMRDYDPATGRYLQPDPLGLYGGLSRYAYVLGDPLSFVDPSGLKGASGSDGGQGKQPSGPTTDFGFSSVYWSRVMENYNQTPEILPWWTSLPGLNPLTPFTTGAVADAVGGLTFGQAEAYRGTKLIGHARLAAGVTSVVNGTLVMGALHTGMLAVSMVSPRVIQ